MSDFRWSFTKLTRYEKCPFSYDQRYNQRIPDPPGKAAARGIELHSTAENFVKGTVENLPESMAHSEYLVGFKERKAHSELEVYFNKKWEVTSKEEHWCVMKMDVVELMGDQVHVWDLKSGKFYPSHFDQFMFYGMGALLKYPQANVALTGAIYIDQPEALPVQRSENRERLPSLISYYENRLSKLLEDTKFDPNPGKHCLWCNYSKKKGGKCRY